MKQSPFPAEPALNITERERTLGLLLRRPYQILAERVYGELARRGYADVRLAHGAVFRSIVPEGSRITEMAERAQMTKQSMGALVEYLRERGYVELQPDPSDGRAKLVHLTARGEVLQTSAVEISREVEREVESLIGEQNHRRLRELLEKLNDGLQETEGVGR